MFGRPTYLGSSVSSTEKDINTRLAKAWTAIDRLSVMWKSDLTDKIKRSFFQAAVVLILLYGCTTWTLTKRMENKVDGNNTRMLRTILNKFWGAPNKAAGVQPLTTHHTNYPSQKNLTCGTQLEKQGQTHKRRTPLDPPHMEEQRQDVQLGPIYNSSVPIQDIALKTNRKRWTIEKIGSRGSGISTLIA